MGFWTRLTFCLSIAIVSVKCDTFTECTGVASETFIGSPNGCEYYIYCDGEDSFEGSCPTDMMFDSLNSVCDDVSNVNCVNDASTTTTTVSPSTTTAAATPPQFTTSPAGISTSTTNAPPTTLSSTSTSTLVTDSDGDVVCPQPSTPSEIIYLPSANSCSEYYMCYRLVAMPMTCPDNLHYNSLTAQCDWPSMANCQVVGSTTVSPKDMCTGQFSGYLEYPSNCHYYYRCTNGFLTVQECPVGFGWDPIRKMCSTTGCSTAH